MAGNFPGLVPATGGMTAPRVKTLYGDSGAFWAVPDMNNPLLVQVGPVLAETAEGITGCVSPLCENYIVIITMYPHRLSHHPVQQVNNRQVPPAQVMVRSATLTLATISKPGWVPGWIIVHRVENSKHSGSPRIGSPVR